MRNTRRFITAIILVLFAASASHALVLSEDNTYWYRNDSGGISTILNPDSKWLNDMVPTDRILVKVEQTVYDMQESAEMLEGNGDGVHPGFLYVYGVTNIGMGVRNDPADRGITEFSVHWGSNPLYMSTDQAQVKSAWVVDDTASVPTWKWTDDLGQGIVKGSGVVGFWAVSNVGVDGVIRASIVQAGPGGPTSWYGTTTGPFVPEPGAYVSLLTGIGGLGLMVRMRGRKKS